MENKITRTLLYVGEEGEVSMEVIIDEERETMWATQKTMAEVFVLLNRTSLIILKIFLRLANLMRIQLSKKF
ncbi:hypothetical protein [uncultured Methanobrevibacter sp.]|uniref:hypothetical protein n=1 Tax=uncultured Methanobrevibacter sp. TaxID=253161 RepID=UPI002632EF71|nr:hypothetical protein [uncultured Methanobrevibacter sp.]